MQFIYFSIKKKREKFLIKDNLNYILLNKIIKIYVMNFLIFQGFNDVLIENKKWILVFYVKKIKINFLKLKMNLTQK